MVVWLAHLNQMGEGITLRALIGKLLAGGGLVCSSTECKVTQNSSGQDWSS